MVKNPRNLLLFDEKKKLEQESVVSILFFWLIVSVSVAFASS